MSELLCIIIVLISFAVQLVILFLTANRFRFLRLAVPVLVGAASVIVILLFCFSTLKGAEGIFILLDIFAILTLNILCLILAGLVLVGWGLAWAVYYLIKCNIS